MVQHAADTRTRIERNHAIVAPDSHVRAQIVGWKQAQGVVLISPAMANGGGPPRFVQYLVESQDVVVSSGASHPGIERLVYVLKGNVILDGRTLEVDHFAYFPPDQQYELSVNRHTSLLVFEKRYEQLEGVPVPDRVVGRLSECESEAFMGDPDARLSTLLPILPAFDMAVNVFTFQPGAALPFTECHVMEHGLYMKQGQGIYRLGDNWYPVCQGDTVWMGSYCPQWFAAIGKQPAVYIYYKDIHRDPLSIAV